MRRPSRIIERLEEKLEDIRPRLGVSAYPRQLLYDVFQAVKSYLLKLYLGDEVTPPAEELPFKVVEAFSYVSPGFFTLPMIVGFDPFDNYTSSEQSFLAVVKYNNNRYYISLSIVKDYNDVKY
ncbi:MAG: hypothetical protein LM579_00075, partial [Thermodesulfobacterium sp.]|nr:hypothetical protein [Thermodesulfobacterium sp.]